MRPKLPPSFPMRVGRVENGVRAEKADPLNFHTTLFFSPHILSRVFFFLNSPIQIRVLIFASDLFSSLSML